MIQQLRGLFAWHTRSGLLLTTLLVTVTALRLGVSIYSGRLNDPAALQEYGTVAQNWIATGALGFFSPTIPSAHMPPGFVVMIIAFKLLFGGAATLALTLILHIAQVVIALLMYLLGLRLHVVHGALVGRLMFAASLLLPSFLFMSVQATSLTVYMLLLLLALVFLLNTSWSFMKRAILSGLCMGAFGWFRFEALLFVIPLAIYLVKAVHDANVIDLRVVKTPQSRLNALVCGAVLVGVFALMQAPWLIRNHQVFGEWLIGTSSGYNLLRGHHANATGSIRDAESGFGTVGPHEVLLWRGPHDSPAVELANDRAARSAAVSFMTENPMKEISLALKKTLYFWVTDFNHPQARKLIYWLPSVFILLIAVASWAVLRYRLTANQWLLLSLLLIQYSLSVVFFVIPRYRLSVEFVMIAFAAIGVAQLWMRRKA